MKFVPKNNTSYVSVSSDLLVRVHKVFYCNIEKDYVKLKASLFHRIYKFIYETKTYKIKLSDIQHWRDYAEEN